MWFNYGKIAARVSFINSFSTMHSLQNVCAGFLYSGDMFLSGACLYKTKFPLSTTVGASF